MFSKAQSKSKTLDVESKVKIKQFGKQKKHTYPLLNVEIIH